MRNLSLIFLLTLSRTAECLVDDGLLRLQGWGGTTSQGRVEIYMNGKWGTVCAQTCGAEMAKVVCRQIGVPEQYIQQSQAILDGRFGAGTGSVIYDEIKCHGYERRLVDCWVHYWTTQCSCGPNDAVGVICYAQPTPTSVFTVPPPLATPPCATTPGSVDNGICKTQSAYVRLIKPSYLHGGGVVQVFVNGRWGGISDDCFNRAAAQVICGMLCYDATKAMPGFDDFDMSGILEPVVLTNVTCVGREKSIFECAHSTSSSSCCELAKVTCVDMTTLMPTIDPPDLNCDNGLITANFSYSWAAFLPHSQISLVWSHGRDCRIQREDRNSYTALSIPFDNICGTQFTWNTTHIMYKNAVLYVPAPTGIITRIRTYMIYLTCILPREYEVLRPLIPITGTLEKIEIANYTIVMFFFCNNFITQVTQYPLPMPVGNWLFVSISIVGHYDYIKLVVSNCYATPSADKNHPTRYPLFTNKCKDDPTVTFYCLSDMEFGFRYQTFKFVQYSEVHIHCEAYVCPKADRSLACDCLCHRNTQGPIGKRKKRETKRDWIFVKSNVIMMYDPADEQGKSGYMGPTLPSYTNNFTTQFHESPRRAPPMPVPDNSISAVKVVGKDDTSSKKKKDFESNNENTASESTGSHYSSSPLQDKDSDVKITEGQDSTVPSTKVRTTTTKQNPENGPVAAESNVDSGSEVSNAKEKVTTVKLNVVNGHVAVESTENSGSFAKEANVSTASPKPTVEASNEVRVTTTHHAGDVLSSLEGGNIPEVDVGTNATFEKLVFNSAPGFCIWNFGFFVGLISFCFSQFLF